MLRRSAPEVTYDDEAVQEIALWKRHGTAVVCDLLINDVWRTLMILPDRAIDGTDKVLEALVTHGGVGRADLAPLLARIRTYLKPGQKAWLTRWING